MLSILIPTYNYSTLALVQELNNQALKLNIDFEILVLDDASNNQEIVAENSEINLIPNCYYHINSENLGRGLNINKLMSISKYENLLIMDCDTFPKDELFLERYFKNLHSEVVYGGIDYKNEKPQAKEMLRWIFGKNRETISLEKRKLNEYNYVLTSNILIVKSVLKRFPFPEYIKTYGFEDLVLVLKLKENNIPILHIDNATFHLNLEKSIVFIEKYHSSLKNLKLLIDTNKISYQDSKLSKLHHKLVNFKLDFIIVKLFDFSKKSIVKNLTSKNPSLALFDFYRLGYFCKLNSKA